MNALLDTNLNCSEFNIELIIEAKAGNTKAMEKLAKD